MDHLGIISRLSDGYLLEKLAEMGASVAAEVQRTGKPGSVTLTLKFSVTNQGDDMVIVADAIATKFPAREGRATFLYAMDGELFTTDPRQPSFREFRTVETESSEARLIDDAKRIVREG